ncbi:MAG: hypothetical protein CVV46_15555 [Spirochaetae bacterium HGW-Spirochaetae-2]|nr:MAG: hypothetical protein CVV46_15555 [Spirochaetae bacterium HGW-Spirochaetae-2]
MLLRFQKPELIRFRFLGLSLYWRGCSDIAVPSAQVCSLHVERGDIPVRRVFVVENDICALSFPPVEGAMVIFVRKSFLAPRLHITHQK